jgi:hypothetical protein
MMSTMKVAKQTISPSTRNKKQKCRLVPLVGLLLNNGKEFTGSYIKKLVELLTIEKMSSLLTTCKEIYQAAEIILYYAPKVSDASVIEIAKGCSQLSPNNDILIL